MWNWLFGISGALAEVAEVASEVPVEEVNGVVAMISQLGFMVVIFGAMYFIMIRPQRKKDKKVKEMLANLKVTDRVTTIGGIFGTIVGMRDDSVILSVGKDNLQMVVARWAIRNITEETLENDAEALN